jgi:hypothetical protein
VHTTGRNAGLFDDLVRDGEYATWNGETKRLAGLEIDDEIKLGRRQDGQIGRFLALQDSASVSPDLISRVTDAVLEEVRGVADPTQGFVQSRLGATSAMAPWMRFEAYQGIGKARCEFAREARTLRAASLNFLRR